MSAVPTPNEEPTGNLALPHLAAQMPIRFANGTIWAALRLVCPTCGNAIPEQQVYGRVTQPTPHVAQAEGHSLCQCDPGRPPVKFLLRVYDDNRVLAHVKGQWRNVELESRPTLLGSILKLLGLGR